MRYQIYGGFEIKRQSNKHGIFNSTFWEQVENTKTGLSTACGCYVFSIKNGNNYIPWYVGKTEKRTFKNECFQPTKINYYNHALATYKGKAVLIFLARRTKSQKRFSKPTSGKYHDVDFLESMLIGKALEKNSKLLNVKKTKLLREMMVPGIINSPSGKPTEPVMQFKNSLGLN